MVTLGSRDPFCKGSCGLRKILPEDASESNNAIEVGPFVARFFGGKHQ